MKSRILYLDIAKALAMFLVVLGHVIITYDSRGYNAPVALGIYSFHTALFMFLSGYFFQSSLNKNFKTLILSKSRQLLLPYFTWGVICLLLIDIPTSGFDISGCLRNFCFGGAFHNYWYVKLLFVYVIVTWLLIKISKNKWIGCAMSWLLFLLLPDFSFSQIFIPFFVIGFLSRALLERVGGGIWIISSVVSLVLLYMLWNPTCNYIFAEMEVKSYIIRTMIGTIVSFLLVITLKQFAKSVNNILIEKGAYIGSITLGIYLCHDLFYRGLIQLWLSAIMPENNIIAYVIVAVGAFGISAAIVTYIRRNKLLSLLFLGNKFETK